MVESSNNGVVVFATGSDFVRYAVLAAKTLKQHSPNIPVHLFTDKTLYTPAFDDIHLLSNTWHRAKIDAMIQSPFDRTLFLDADMLITAPIDDVFDLLERFEIGAVHDSERNAPHANRIWRTDLPATFPQYNTGMVLYRRCPAIQRFLTQWRDAVKSENHSRDQPTFRELLWQSDLRIATLPAEYNYCDLRQFWLFSGFTPAPRILHYYQRKPVIDTETPLTEDMILTPAEQRIIARMRQTDRHLSSGKGSARGTSPLAKLWLRLGLVVDAVRLSLRSFVRSRRR